MSEARESSLPVVVAITGATGAIYGIRLLETLRELKVETHLVVSRWAHTTIRAETNWTPDEVLALATHSYAEDEIAAPPASSTLATAGMVIAPCSMRTVAAIANEVCDNLVEHAAEVHLKGRRRLVLVARESPMSVIHLENMLSLAREGAVIAPPVPAFYAKPRSLDEMVDHTVGRVLDHAGIEHDRIRRWGEL